jgi:hypothetical protein
MNEIADRESYDAFIADDEGGLERRLFRSMCVAVVVAVLSSLLFWRWRVTTGLLLGGALSLFNHHWLRSSISAAFGVQKTSGVRPRLKASRFVLRYLIVVGVIYLANLLNVISLPATIAGMCSFVVALFVEAFIQLYFAIAYREET